MLSDRGVARLVALIVEREARGLVSDIDRVYIGGKSSDEAGIADRERELRNAALATAYRAAAMRGAVNRGPLSLQLQTVLAADAQRVYRLWSAWADLLIRGGEAIRGDLPKLPDLGVPGALGLPSSGVVTPPKLPPLVRAGEALQALVVVAAIAAGFYLFTGDA